MEKHGIMPNILIGIMGVYGILLTSGYVRKNWKYSNSEIETFEDTYSFSENWLVILVTFLVFIFYIYMYMYRDYLYEIWLSIYSMFINPANLGMNNLFPGSLSTEKDSLLTEESDTSKSSGETGNVPNELKKEEPKKMMPGNEEPKKMMPDFKQELNQSDEKFKQELAKLNN